MTAAELIAILAAYPPQLKVVTPGFDEFGYSDLATVEQVGLREARETSVGPLYFEPSALMEEAADFQAVMLNF